MSVEGCRSSRPVWIKAQLPYNCWGDVPDGATVLGCDSPILFSIVRETEGENWIHIVTWEEVVVKEKGSNTPPRISWGHIRYYEAQEEEDRAFLKEISFDS